MLGLVAAKRGKLSATKKTMAKKWRMVVPLKRMMGWDISGNAVADLAGLRRRQSDGLTIAPAFAGGFFDEGIEFGVIDDAACFGIPFDAGIKALGEHT